MKKKLAPLIKEYNKKHEFLYVHVKFSFIKLFFSPELGAYLN